MIDGSVTPQKFRPFIHIRTMWIARNFLRGLVSGFDQKVSLIKEITGPRRKFRGTALFLLKPKDEIFAGGHHRLLL